MSKRSHRHAREGRDQRRDDFDRMKLEQRRGRKRPGSLNPRRSAKTRQGKRR